MSIDVTYTPTFRNSTDGFEDQEAWNYVGRDQTVQRLRDAAVDVAFIAETDDEQLMANGFYFLISQYERKLYHRLTGSYPKPSEEYLLCAKSDAEALESFLSMMRRYEEDEANNPA